MTSDTNANVAVANEMFEEVKKKIVHILTVYNRISPSMLQCGIGTSVPPKLWRPILYKLIKSGEILQEEEMRLSPSGRYNMYTILSLNQSAQPKLDSEPNHGSPTPEPTNAAEVELSSSEPPEPTIADVSIAEHSRLAVPSSSDD